MPEKMPSNEENPAEEKPFDPNDTVEYEPLQEHGPVESTEGVVKRYRKKIKETADPAEKDILQAEAKEKIKENKERAKRMGQE